MTLAEKITLLRKQKGWSQEELAEKMDISRQSVSKWESGTSVPDLDKIIKISQIFAVSTDYLLKEENEDGADTEFATKEAPDDEMKRSVSIEEATAFMDLTNRVAGKMAAGCSLCVFSAIPLIVMGGMAECGKTAMTEDMAGGLGAAILLVLVAIGVVMIVLCGMKLSCYEYLEVERISLQYGVRDLAQKRKEQYEPVHQKRIVSGVAGCILGVVPLLISTAMNAEEMVFVYCVAFLLFIISCSVYLFVKSGMIYDCYNMLLQEGDYTEQKKELKRRTSFFSGAYWCLMVAIYLGISFYYEAWEKTWIIWPVAGVLYAALINIINAILAKERHLS